MSLPGLTGIMAGLAAAAGGGGGGTPSNSGGTTATGTSHTVPLPATVGAGDLLVILFAIRNGTITWDNTTAGTWSLTGAEGFDRLNALGSRPRLICASKICDGSEGGKSLGLTGSSSRPGAYRNYHYPAGSYVDFECVGADGDFNYDPGTLTPSWGSQSVEWIAVMAMDSSAGGNTATVPSGYANTTTDESVSASTSILLVTGRKTATASSENPGVFTPSTGSALLSCMGTLGVRL